MAGIPPLNSEVLSAVEKLAAKPEVRAAFAEAERDVDRAMREQIELCEIEAPTFHEENRAKRVAELMRTYGLKGSDWQRCWPSTWPRQWAGARAWRSYGLSFPCGN